MLSAVPSAPAGAPLAVGPPLPPFAPPPPLPRPVRPTWTWTVLPAVTSEALAGDDVWYVVSAPVPTVIVCPLAVLIVMESAVVDSTVPLIVRPPPPNPPPRMKPPLPLAPGTKLPNGRCPLPFPLPLATNPPRLFPDDAVDADAVPRPIANATPPMATHAAIARTAFSQRPEPRRLAGGGGAIVAEGAAGVAVVVTVAPGAICGCPTGAVGTAEVASPSVAASGRAQGEPGAGAWDGSDGSGPVGRSGSMVTVCSLSLVAEGADGVEAGRLARRPHAEHDPDGEAEEDGGHDGHRVEDETPA